MYETVHSWKKLLLKCCFTSTETVGLLRTGAQDIHLDFHTAERKPGPDIGQWEKVTLGSAAVRRSVNMEMCLLLAVFDLLAFTVDCLCCVQH